MISFSCSEFLFWNRNTKSICNLKLPDPASYFLTSRHGVKSVWFALCAVVKAAVQQVNRAVSAQDPPALLAALRLQSLALLGVLDSNCHWYLEHFTTYCKPKVHAITH